MKDFLETVRQNTIVCDGAMGTELAKVVTLPDGAPPEIANVEFPDKIRAIHEAYIEAGAGAILTNTFGANRMRLAEREAGDRTEEFNRAAAAIAKEAAKGRAFVLGNISSTGQESLLPPFGTKSEDEFLDSFREQAAVLSEAGVDALFVETMSTLTEAELALRAAREVSALPLLCTMTFRAPAAARPDDFRTFWGDSVDRIVETLTEAGANVIGANCGEIVEEMPALAKSLREHTELPLIFEVNAGKPQLDSQYQTIYAMAPEEIAVIAKELREAGANLIGGCCGTTPAHIRAMSEALSDTV